MTSDRLAEIRQHCRMMAGVTAAAQIANELLAEVDRLRKLAPPEWVDPRSVESVAAAIGVAPRTLRLWVYRGRLTLDNGRVDVEGLIEFVQANGWDSMRAEELRAKVTEVKPS